MSTQTATYQSYDLYNDPGVATIGLTPQHWKKIKVKNAFDFKKIKSREENPVVLSLARDGVKIRDISNNEGQIAESYINYNKVNKGDLLLNPMDLYSGANCSISYVEGVISPAYVNLRTKTLFYSKYYDYFFKTLYWNKFLLAYGKGVSIENRWTLTNDTLKNIFIPQPPYEEQQKISSFLDKKIIKINKIIRNKKRLIDLLQEKRQALITQAVTKGLDPNAKMKNSGVEWIGEIPEKWSINKTFQIFEHIGSGTTPSTNNEKFYDGSIHWIQSGDINAGTINDTEKTITTEAIAEYSALRIYKPNSIVIAMYGASVGNVGITEIEACTNQACCVLTSSAQIDPWYGFYYFLISKAELISMGRGGGQPNINKNIIKYHKVPLPKLNEQKQIVKYIKDIDTKITATLHRVSIQIDKLKEYKSALIYNAVTGKIKV